MSALRDAANRRRDAEDLRSDASAELYAEIRKAAERGMTWTQIATEAGVSRQTVANALKGQ